MNKIYKKNNYIIITGPDIISEFPITNIYVDKKELTNEYYIYFNSVTSKCVAIVSIPNILKEDNTPYTEEEWETFYTVNTGFFFNVGGGGDTGAIPADQFVDVYSDLPDPTTVIYQIWIVKNSEGTSWLPGSLGGTYYPEGGYASDGTKWIYHKDSYQASQLEVDAGIVTNKWLTPFTFENAAKWLDKYDSSNPSGFTSNMGTVTNVSAITLGTTGTNLSSSVATGTTTPTITLNVPDASATARGVITTGTQTIAGEKTFLNTTIFTSNSESIAQVIDMNIDNSAGTIYTFNPFNTIRNAITIYDSINSIETFNIDTQGNLNSNSINTGTINGNPVVFPQTGQIIVTSGTSFTTPSTITTTTVFNIELIGGGGGGGGGGSAICGSAGGAGGYVFKRITGLSPSTTYTCAIGAAGSAGAFSSDGTAGGSTTLTISGTTYAASGGGKGIATAAASGGAGGIGTNGDINITGQKGQDSIGSSITTMASSQGGSSPKAWGLGGLGVPNSTSGQAGTGYGAGGSGGKGSTGSPTGGAGSQGIIFCQWFNQ